MKTRPWGAALSRRGECATGCGAPPVDLRVAPRAVQVPRRDVEQVGTARVGRAVRRAEQRDVDGLERAVIGGAVVVEAVLGLRLEREHVHARGQLIDVDTRPQARRGAALGESQVAHGPPLAGPRRRQRLERAVDAVVGRPAAAEAAVALAAPHAVGDAVEVDRPIARGAVVARVARASAAGEADTALVAARRALSQRAADAGDSAVPAAVVHLQLALDAHGLVAKVRVGVVVDAPSIVQVGPRERRLDEHLAAGSVPPTRAIAPPEERHAHATVGGARRRATAAAPVPRVAGEERLHGRRACAAGAAGEAGGKRRRVGGAPAGRLAHRVELRLARRKAACRADEEGAALALLRRGPVLGVRLHILQVLRKRPRKRRHGLQAHEQRVRIGRVARRRPRRCHHCCRHRRCERRCHRRNHRRRRVEAALHLIARRAQAAEFAATAATAHALALALPSAEEEPPGGGGCSARRSECVARQPRPLDRDARRLRLSLARPYAKKRDRGEARRERDRRAGLHCRESCTRVLFPCRLHLEGGHTCCSRPLCGAAAGF
eukprot:805431-Prymnesium_polylepis.2